MFRFIAADLRRQWIGVLAVTLIVALATALGVVVTLQERALRLGSARAAAPFDIIVGAPGSETQLVLSAVFLQPAPLTLLPGSVLAGLMSDPRVAYAAPIGFGDFIDDHPIVGTTQSLVDGISHLAVGRRLQSLGDAVVGAQVPMAVGTTFHPMHGQIGASGHAHGEVSYHVVGRLAATGTPWDRAVLVPIEAVWRVHSHAPLGIEADAHHHTEDDNLQGAHGHTDDHAPETAQPGARRPATPNGLEGPIHPDVLADPRAPGVPAIVVKPRSIADAYKLRQELRTDRTLAVFPGEVLTRLYATLGDARQVIALVAMGAQGLVAAAILLVVLVHVVQRRRQIGALRAFGAPRGVVCAIVWLEVFAILGAGLLAGFGVGFVAARIIADRLARASGLVLPVAFTAADVGVLVALLMAGAGMALIPAVLAYRHSPAQALRA